ncbi:hypothetical protein [Vibrio jasicida]|uniref:hypothetical protein n=1 Tax=Vibrio jasicida TaxID=766224 RepID=UPI000CE54675|nr:hypothetical protein [Vibrio jasicida]
MKTKTVIWRGNVPVVNVSEASQAGGQVRCIGGYIGELYADGYRKIIVSLPDCVRSCALRILATMGRLPELHLVIEGTNTNLTGLLMPVKEGQKD